MKRILRTVIATLMVLALSASCFAEMIINRIPVSKEEFTIETESFDETWLFENIDSLDAGIYQDLAIAFYIVSTIQYGSSLPGEVDGGTRPRLSSVLLWLDITGLDCTVMQTDCVTTLSLSEHVHIDLSLDNDAITAADVRVQGLSNAFGNDMQVHIDLLSAA